MSARFLFGSIIVVGLVTAGVFIFRSYRPAGMRAARVFAWLRNPGARTDLVISAGTRCEGAPFVFPSTGIVGFLWDDSFHWGHRHQGIDVFGGTDVNVTPVVAAYGGFLTRLTDWKSSVIVRVPNDPLQPGQQIWIYYTHMADAVGNSFISSDYPPGTYEKLVEIGTLLGFQGDYSGDPNNPVGVHLHLSIVKDGGGHFLNELDILNTYDPSPYFGLALNAKLNPDRIPTCSAVAEATVTP
jgi:hypothetical protein